MDDLISVIVPIYNCEKTIARCVDSIIQQTYKNLEILLIDDGSTDRGMEYCNTYVQEDQRIKVVWQRNLGVSATRNLGIRESTGKYIVFIDADDYIEKDYVEILYQDLRINKADMVCCNYTEFDTSGKERIVSCYKHKLKISGCDKCLGTYWGIGVEKNFFGAVWGRMITRELACKHEFLVGQKQGEDAIYVYELLTEGPIIYFTTYAGYHYCRREDSATLCSEKIEMAVQFIKLGEIISRYANIGNNQINSMAKNEYALKIYMTLSRLLKQADKKEYERYRPILQRHVEKALEDKTIKMKYKISLTIYSKFPSIYWYCLGKLLKMKGYYEN